MSKWTSSPRTLLHVGALVRCHLRFLVLNAANMISNLYSSSPKSGARTVFFLSANQVCPKLCLKIRICGTAPSDWQAECLSCRNSSITVEWLAFMQILGNVDSVRERLLHYEERGMLPFQMFPWPSS